MLYADAAELIRAGACVVRDSETAMQLMSIEASTLRAPEGLHDDRADAFVLALVAPNYGDLHVPVSTVVEAGIRWRRMMIGGEDGEGSAEWGVRNAEWCGLGHGGEGVMMVDGEGVAGVAAGEVAGQRLYEPGEADSQAGAGWSCGMSGGSCRRSMIRRRGCWRFSGGGCGRGMCWVRRALAVRILASALESMTFSDLRAIDFSRMQSASE